MDPNISAARVRELLSYDPETGIFTWKVSPVGWLKPGRVAGQTNNKGYIVIGIERRSVMAHRLAWLYMTGEWPDRQVDHIDCARANNRWSNLRLATPSQQSGNARLRRDNTSGFKGVSFMRRKNLYIAQINKGGRLKFLGYFRDPSEAHAAYVAAAEEYWGEYARAA